MTSNRKTLVDTVTGISKLCSSLESFKWPVSSTEQDKMLLVRGDGSVAREAKQSTLVLSSACRSRELLDRTSPSDVTPLVLYGSSSTSVPYATQHSTSSRLQP
ncbi:hypothetical protein GN956_G8522 [Arapaima gigas]